MSDKVIEQTRRWVEQVVIQLNLCPFAAAPFKKDRIRYYVSHALDANQLVDELLEELILLKDTPAREVETTLFIVPNAFSSFDEYNQFGVILDQLIYSLKLQGIIQVATFHPDYQFSDLARDDVRNYTNRSPYPMFHLIREDSVERARNSYTEIESIPEKNMQKLLEMGINAVNDLLKASNNEKS